MERKEESRLTGAAMNHDPLCLEYPATDNSRCHYCVLIAKVREDEQKNAGDRVCAVFAGDWPGSPAYLGTLRWLRKAAIAAAMDDRDFSKWNKP